MKSEEEDGKGNGQTRSAAFQRGTQPTCGDPAGTEVEINILTSLLPLPQPVICQSLPTGKLSRKQRAEGPLVKFLSRILQGPKQGEGGDLRGSR